ncbi:HEAT repeat domain-containing protein [Amycolatopsis cynarae]|uniref:HEAT repeat domain-containing protein n=1 Tax=Amycolatopsis cynarae TaxID=2995223 RepID=A0ABY7AXC6_9PSEU|nr:HEAT repeat domain-containing protein [Amycolatopsis sp. HUAS 11-8]WAL64355.1 HEAT repeat domain-containing protein [Amycolatopsis sp. HUAS 11-8]
MDVEPGELVDRAAAVSDPESDEYWGLIRRLHDRTDRAVFDVALTAARSTEIRRRLVGLDALGQIGYAADRPFRAETLAALLAEAAQAADDRLIASAVTALGHLSDPRARPGILRHAAHPSKEVRFAVAVALPGATDADAPDADVVEALIRLTRDPDTQVRDWATFGLGTQLDADTPAVRAALTNRLDDPDGDTAGEALLGLARRHDPRALPRVLAWLDDDPGNLIIEAAGELAAPECLPALLRLKDRDDGGDNAWSAGLDEAIAACASARPTG